MGFAHSKEPTITTVNAFGGQYNGSDDVWTLEDRHRFYSWKDWRLMRTEDCLFIWCDAIVLEFSDASQGWIRYYKYMNGRLGALLHDCIPNYHHDNASNRAEFLGNLRKAKLAIPTGARTKFILSIPRKSRTIQSGNWNLSSEKAGTLLLINQKLTQVKITIKENLPGFIYEFCVYRVQLFTVSIDSTRIYI